MPTPLDRAMQSRNTFLAFTGIVTAVAAWSIWGGDVFPAEKDPSGGMVNYDLSFLNLPVQPQLIYATFRSRTLGNVRAEALA
ncbi:MAG: hypothetical protein M1827_000709 [Pycnora praestabilis]|nr:MAG: hypothetical protein M1827_000709 [Pycnora praestabilis]